MNSELSFKQLKVDNWLQKNLELVGIIKPTQIQQDTLVHTLKGKNLIGCAQTGSGKTACFAIPMLQKLAADPYGVFGIVLTPTRELAFQIMEQFKVFAGSNFNLRISVIVGGVDMMKQADELQQIPHIIITTPGRFVHHIQNDQMQLNEYLQNLQFLVIDEADRVLTDECFKDDLNVILDALPKQRQTLLFSATMVKDYDKIISKEKLFGSADLTNNLVECGNNIEIDQQFQLTVQGLNQKFALVPENVKEAYLIYILKQNTLKKTQQCIIFTSTCRNCSFLSMVLGELGFDVTYLHSMLNQRSRLKNIGKFKSNYHKILVATDVASRGLDIPQVQLIINFDLPKNPKDYVHRVGRTARAGRGGSSVTLVTQYDIKLLLAAEEYINTKLEKVDYNEKEVLEDINHIMKVMQVVRIKMSENGMDEQFEDFKQKKQVARDAKSEGANSTKESTTLVNKRVNKANEKSALKTSKKLQQQQE